MTESLNLKGGFLFETSPGVHLLYNAATVKLRKLALDIEIKTSITFIFLRRGDTSISI